MKAVVLKAEDWTKFSGDWDSDFPFSLKEAYIAGILLDENDKFVILSQCFFSTAVVRDVLCIPKSNILWRKDVEIEDLGEDKNFDQ